jgi:hypothetical protein
MGRLPVFGARSRGTRKLGMKRDGIMTRRVLTVRPDWPLGFYFK